MAIPHDGWKFPDELMESVNVSKKEFLAYHEKMRDLKMNSIVPPVQKTGSHVERFEISRLLHPQCRSKQ